MGSVKGIREDEQSDPSPWVIGESSTRSDTLGEMGGTAIPLGGAITCEKGEDGGIGVGSLQNRGVTDLDNGFWTSAWKVGV